jgi:ABC-2 type transport system permease protein
MTTILAVAKNRLLNLRRDRAAFVLAFVLPVAFFSIFAGIFAGSGRSAATRKIEVLVADEDGSPNAALFIEGLKREKGLDVRTSLPSEKGAGAKPGALPVPFTAATAEAAVRHGDAPVAVVVPKGFGERPIRFGPEGERPIVRILADSADPIAPQVLAGLIQKVVMTSMPQAMARSGMDEVDRWSGGLTAEQKARMEEALRSIGAPPPPGQAAPQASAAAEGLVRVETRDVVGETKANPTVAFYAAGFGVMFLLFSAAGAGGALIEEAESGTLDRILSTKVDMTHLLLGKLVYLAGVGIVQLTLMFVWGALVFGMDLAGHLPGFVVMTVATAVASSTFGLMLASVARSRMQLVAISNLSILLMSALGGSMYPRFLMPEKMQKIGLLTLNAWAIDGFQKIFWRDEPVWSVWPQVAVLVGIGIVFFLIARRLAERWEAA